MAHIALPEGLPGIIGPMTAYPDSAKALNMLAEILLTQESPTLNKAERETVASYVSYLNECIFCSESHGAVADFHWKKEGLSKQVWNNPNRAPIDARLKALLLIAEHVQKGGKKVTEDDVKMAKELGASDADIHDTVLIAAAFCMFNRYVDGLNTMAPPRNDESYKGIGKMLGECGYLNSIK